MYAQNTGNTLLEHVLTRVQDKRVELRAGQFISIRSCCLSVNKMSIISIHFIIYMLLIYHLYRVQLKGKGIRCPSLFR